MLEAVIGTGTAAPELSQIARPFSEPFRVSGVVASTDPSDSSMNVARATFGSGSGTAIGSILSLALSLKIWTRAVDRTSCESMNPKNGDVFFSLRLTSRITVSHGAASRDE